MTFTVTINSKTFKGLEKPEVRHEGCSLDRPRTVLYDGSSLDIKNRVYEIIGHLDYEIRKDPREGS